jgi:hypothetical protein
MKLPTNPINCHGLEHKTSTSTLQSVVITQCLTVQEKLHLLPLLVKFVFPPHHSLYRPHETISILLFMVHRHNTFVCHVSYQYAFLIA